MLLLNSGNFISTVTEAKNIGKGGVVVAEIVFCLPLSGRLRFDEILF